MKIHVDTIIPVLDTSLCNSIDEDLSFRNLIYHILKCQITATFLLNWFFPILHSVPEVKAQLTADRGGAGGTLLGKQVAEAVEAVSKVVPWSEALASQLHLAADAHKALLVPGLVPVAHPASGDRLKEQGSCYWRKATTAADISSHFCYWGVELWVVKQRVQKCDRSVLTFSGKLEM